MAPPVFELALSQNACRLSLINSYEFIISMSQYVRTTVYTNMSLNNRMEGCVLECMGKGYLKLLFVSYVIERQLKNKFKGASVFFI